MEIGVARASRLLGISPQRIRSLIAQGELPARREGSFWLVDTDQPWPPLRIARPLGPRMMSAVLDQLSGQEPKLDRRQRHRLDAYVERLLNAPDPAALLSSWQPATSRSSRIRASIAPTDLAEFRQHDLVLPTGISDPRANIAVTNYVQCYITADSWRHLREDFLIASTGRVNILVHLLAGGLPTHVQLGQLLADLSAWSGPREKAAVRRLLDGVVEGWRAASIDDPDSRI